MSYFPIQNARGEREKYPRLRSGLRTDGRILPLHLFSRNFFEILESHFSWQAQYLVMLEGNLCCSAHCK